MPEIVSDAKQVYETPIEAANDIYLHHTNPGLGAEIPAALQEGPSAYLGRAAQRGTVAGASAFDIGAAALTAVGGAPEATPFALPAPIQSPTLQPDEYNERYAPRDVNGSVIPIGDKPMPEALAKIIGRQKTEALQRESVLSRYAETHGGLTTFAVGTLASQLDPLNSGALFVPALGEGAILARVGAGVVGRTVARLGAGATTGALVATPFAGLRAALDPEEAGDYGMRNALQDVFYGAAGFAALHAGFGAVGDVWRAFKPARVETAPLLPGLGGPDAATQNAIMRAGIGQLVEGRPFDISLYQPPRAETAIGLAMERPGRAEILGAPDVEAQARRLAPEVFARYDGLVQRLTELRTRIQDPEGTFGADIDRQIATLRARAEAARGDVVQPVGLSREELADRVAEQTRTYEQATRAAETLAAQRAGLIHAQLVAARLEHAGVDAQLRDIAGTGEVARAKAQAENIVGARAAGETTAMGPSANTPGEIAAAAAERAVLPRQLEGGSIASDYAGRLVAAGRPAEEAAAHAGLLQSFYESMATTFRGALGTAEDLYRGDYPDVVRGLGGELAQGELGQAPSEIKGHPDGETEDAQWRALEPETTAAGAYRGAPEWVTNRRGLTRLRGVIQQLVGEGTPGRFWYEDSAKEVLRIVRGNLAEAERFIGLLAIYSPQSPVFTNTTFAIKAFNQWKRGETINVKTGIQDEKAFRWLEHGEDWGGRKTNSFYVNLMHYVVTEHPEAIRDLNIPPDVLDVVKRATVDLWVLRALGYRVDAAGGVSEGAGNKYGFAERELQRLAGFMNQDLPEGSVRWLPHQVQAALWSAVKARYELPEVKKATWAESIKRGFARKEEDENGVERQMAPAKNGPEKQGHMAIWRKFALAAPADEVARQVELAKGSFGDAINRVAQNITAEVVPTSFAASIGHPIATASRAAKEGFTREGLSLITDDDGNDVLAAQLGVNLNYSRIGAGLFEGEINPTVVTTLVPEKPPGMFDAAKARQYARAWQYIFRQDAVPFRADSAINFKGDYAVRNAETGAIRRFDKQRDAQAYADRLTAEGKTATVAGRKFAKGIHLEFAQDLDEAAQSRLAEALKAELGNDSGFTKTGDREAIIINFRGDDGLPFVDDHDFGAAIERIAAREDLGIGRVSHFGSEGEYGPVHNWQVDGSGGSIPEAAGGSPAFQAWLHDRHQAFGQLLDDWRDTARIAAAERDAAVRQPPGEPGRGVAAEPGIGPSPRGPPAELEQAGRAKIRPATDLARALITLFQTADASSFIHEFFHHAARTFFTLSDHPMAPADLRADAAVLRRNLGMREGETVLTTAQQEQLAQWGEQYAMSGKAPKPELNNVFAKMRAWMLKIYQDISALGVPINDEVRGVFDRWFAAAEGGETPGTFRTDITINGRTRTIEGPTAPGVPRADPIGLAIRQLSEQRQGWAPGLSGQELAAANDAVYGARPVGVEAPAPRRAPGAGAAAEVPPEMAMLEEQMGRLPPEALHPDDRAMLETADEGLTKATTLRSAYETAASCLVGLAA